MFYSRIKKWWRERNSYECYMGTIDSINQVVKELERQVREAEAEEAEAEEVCRHVDGLDKVIAKKKIRKIRGE